MSVKGSCTICTDYFSNAINISVTICGHLFHDKCLAQWLKTKGTQKTCPQCRSKLNKQQIVKKLYINAPDDQGEDLNPHLLKNDICELELKLTELQKKNFQVTETLRATERSRDTLKTKIQTLKRDVTDKQQVCDILKQQLLDKSDLEERAEKAQKEAEEIREKFDTMKKVEIVLNGTKEDVNSMIKQYTGSSTITSAPGVRQLATFCISLKQEYNELKSRNLRKTADLMKLKKLDHKHKTMIENLNDKISSLENQEKSSKQEMSSLNSRIQSLMSAIESPSETRSSAISRLMHESPAPMTMTPDAGSMERKFNAIKRHQLPGKENLEFKKPRLSSSFNKEDVLLSSDDEIVAPPKQREFKKLPVPKFDSPHTKEAKEICREYDLKFVKIKSMKNKPGSTNSRPKLMMNNFKSKSDKDSISRVGYNGFGGHSKHVFGSVKNRPKFKVVNK